MTAGHMTAQPRAELHSRTEIALGLVRISKIKVFQQHFGVVLAWLLLSPEAVRRPSTTAAMLLFLLGSIAIVACTCSADDIVGFRNGSDAVNYKMGETLRDIRAKPLLSGAVTEAQALAFSIASGVTAVVAGLAAFQVLGWQAPLPAYLCYFGGMFLAVQYSAGLKVSYHRGGGEAVLFLAHVAGLLAPFLAVNREWSLPAVLGALLAGLWIVMVSSYSNVNDVEGDRSVGRRTMAVAASPAIFKSMMVFFVIAEIGLVLALAFGVEGWPWWTVVTALPAIALHARQLYIGAVRHEWLRARRLGMIAYNFAFAGIAVPTFVAMHM